MKDKTILAYMPQPAPYGGMEQHVVECCCLLAANGWEVLLLVTNNSLGGRMRGRLADAGVALREMGRPRGGVGAKTAWLLFQVASLRMRRWKWIYTNGQSALARIVWHAGRGGTKVVHHHHTSADAEERRGWSRGYRALISTAPGLIACSESARKEIMEAAGRGDVRTLYYLTTLTSEDSPAAQGVAAGRGSAMRLGFIGRLLKQKGLDTILRIAMNPRLAGVEWHLYGDSGDFSAPDLAAVPRVTWHGPFASAEALRGIHGAVDAVVLFSRHSEGMPLSLLEAMSSGLPWIASDRGGTREMAISQADCIVLPRDCTDEDCIAGILEMAERIRSGRTSREGQRKAWMTRFAPATTRRAWLDYFEGQ